MWLLEGGFKAYLLGSAFWHGFNPLQELARDYHTWNRAVFFLASTFIIIETIGPWIGIYYLTGCRSLTTPFNKALVRTLKTAVGVTIVASLILMLYLEITAPVH